MEITGRPHVYNYPGSDKMKRLATFILLTMITSWITALSVLNVIASPEVGAAGAEYYTYYANDDDVYVWSNIPETFTTNAAYRTYIWLGLTTNQEVNNWPVFAQAVLYMYPDKWEV